MAIRPGARNNFGDVIADGKTHKGLDIAPPDNGNDALVAPERSTLVDFSLDADNTPRFKGYGPAVLLLRGDSGVFHLLAHMDQTATPITIGQVFEEGEQVGLISRKGPLGNGQPTKFWLAPHVHWEVRTKLDGGTINPIAWLGGKVEGFGISIWVWILVGIALARRR